MKKSITSNTILFLSSFLLIKVSLSFIILSAILLIVIFWSYMNINKDATWILGFSLIGRAKKVYSNHGKNFWILITRDENNLYYAYLLEDKLFHCKVIECRSEYNGDIEKLKSTINLKLDRYQIDINRGRNYQKRMTEAFNNWDGCLTKGDSRNKKINEIC